ncbi:MAG: phosphate ABC transporter substrate-binding protein PstS [Chloroflexota bacterium]
MNRTARALILSLLAVGVLAVVACGGGTDGAKATASSAAPGAAATRTPTQSPAAAIALPESVPNRVELTGAGATFPYPLYSKWFDEYSKTVDPNVRINYQSIGSGGGIKQITERTVDFGATDGFMNEEQLAAAPGILHIPMTLGAVVPTYNLPGVTAELKFTGEVLAGIYLGQIKKWNDQRLKDLNPGINLPDADLTVVHRSDGSGTTYIFTDYLSTISPEWRQRVGTGTSVNWPVGIGGKGNEGVTAVVKQTPGAIGYVELIYAEQNKLPYGAVRNRAGQFVKASLDTVSAAAAGAAASAPDHLRISIVNADGPNAYPIAGFTWLLVYDTMTDPLKAQALTGFMWWALHDPRAQQIQRQLLYAPVPPEIVTKAERLIRSITVNGQPALKLRQ